LSTARVYNDNATIFDEILKGNADVMISEPVETIVQPKLRPGPCAVDPDKPLQHGEMAWLLLRGDSATKRWMDAWLHLAKSSGDYELRCFEVVALRAAYSAARSSAGGGGLPTARCCRSRTSVPSSLQRVAAAGCRLPRRPAVLVFAANTTTVSRPEAGCPPG